MKYHLRSAEGAEKACREAFYGGGAEGGTLYTSRERPGLSWSRVTEPRTQRRGSLCESRGEVSGQPSEAKRIVGLPARLRVSQSEPSVACAAL